MRTRWLLLRLFAGFGLFTLPFAILAQTPDAAKSQAKHSLWRVEGKTNSLYFFGSIHFLKKEFYPLDPPIEDAYRRCQTLVLEADFEDLQSPKTQLKMLQMGRYPEGETLKQHLSKETYGLLESHLTASIGSGAVFDSFKPWMVAVALLGVELQKLGFDPEQGVDKYFSDKARADQKPVVPLETAEFQLNLFSGFTAEEEETMVKETLQEVSSLKKVIGEMTEAWRTGDAKKLDDLTLEDMRGYPRLYKKLLSDRNERWSQKFEKMLAGGGNAFVVVGAAHLVGKDSVLELLRKKGFAVRQL